MMTLYSYWRSTAAYRVRIALNLKSIDYQFAGVDLVKDGGEQHGDAYAAVNAQKLVPALMLDDGSVLTQSLAIIDYLEQIAPAPALYPAGPLPRAKCLAFSHAIAMDIHPVNNLRVVQKLAADYGADNEQKAAWMRHWMTQSFVVLEQQLGASADNGDGGFAFGAAPTLADICLVAQLYNAKRWGVELTPYPQLTALDARCLALDAFSAASPENQPDAPSA